MKIRCVGIGCSPRRNGNTSLLLERALEGAKDGGAETEAVYLRELKFSPCLGCDGCQKHGLCVVQDDMQPLYDKLLNSDRIIIAAPIFSMGINSQGKAMIDRGQRFWSTKYVLKQDVVTPGSNRQGIFISAAGTDLKGVFECAIRSVKYFYKMLDVNYAGDFCFSKVDKKGEILDHPDALTKVYNAGIDLIMK